MIKRHRIVLLFVLSVVFATAFALAINVSANAQSYGDTGSEKCGATSDRNGDGTPDAWDRNSDGVMDAFDGNFDGIIESEDMSISCAQVTRSNAPVTGAPILALATVAAVTIGTGLILRKSRG